MPRLCFRSTFTDSSFSRLVFPPTSRASNYHHQQALLELRRRKQCHSQPIRTAAQVSKRGDGAVQNELATPLPENLAKKASLSDQVESKGMSYQDNNYAPREPGQRRKKLAGYLKAANELRQTYTQQYTPNWSSREIQYDYQDNTPGAFPDAAALRSGEEEMILFPSYARNHVKRELEAIPTTAHQWEGQSRAGDAEFWKREWNIHEDDTAVVDVDVRGWIYSPHTGQMSRKQRLFVGLARQLVGVPVVSSPATSSRDASPQRPGFRGRTHLRQAQHDEELAVREAEHILRKGEKEAAAAAKGAYSEKPCKENGDGMQPYPMERVRTAESFNERKLSHATSSSSLPSEDSISPMQRRASWQQPANMSPAELAEANARLMARLRHFLAIPMANTPISIFFYNDDVSKQRTVYTDLSGHFSISAALDFVPTHVRILASDRLSRTEKVTITNTTGVSVISDIDDTIKHSAISSGAREIFRNAFIRDLQDLTIQGVREWYIRMAELGAEFHYVSNSPWQLFPVISSFFSVAGLPPGSFHLKQYSGMLQGIFEPVAERKKVTLDKIARDFPERNFILIGDSGEADLEVYTDFVLENPGRILAIFIRDVTTSEKMGFFDSNPGASSEDGGADLSSSSLKRNNGSDAMISGQFRASSEVHDPELSAALAASLREFEEDERRRSESAHATITSTRAHLRPTLPGRPATQYASSYARREPSSNSIGSSVDTEPEIDPVADSKHATEGRRLPMTSRADFKPVPPPPRKPVALRSAPKESSPSTCSSTSKTPPPPPPPPRRSMSTVNHPSPLSQQTSDADGTKLHKSPTVPVTSKPTLDSQEMTPCPSEQTYSAIARNKLWSLYSNLPALRSQDEPSSSTSADPSAPQLGGVQRGPPPPLPRQGSNRGLAADNKASHLGPKASLAGQSTPSTSYSTRPHTSSAKPTSQTFSTTTATATATGQQGTRRTSAATTLGSNAGNGQYVNKREQSWRQRWARAEQLMAEHGVILRTWRIGTDAMQEAERAIKEAKRKMGKGGL